MESWTAPPMTLTTLRRLPEGFQSQVTRSGSCDTKLQLFFMKKIAVFGLAQHCCRQRKVPNPSYKSASRAKRIPYYRFSPHPTRTVPHIRNKKDRYVCASVT